MPAVSVLMPVYNTEHFVAQAIASICNQSHTDFELIIIDDGSRDDTVDQIRTIASHDSRICLLSRPNKGVVATRNELLRLSKSPLIAWMDSDDWSYPERLALQVCEMESDPDLVAVGGQARYIDADGRPIGMHRMPCDHESIDAIHMSGSGHAMLQGCSMMRRDALLRCGGYTEGHVAEDIELWLRLAEHGRLANIDSVLLDYRLHLSSYGHQNRASQSDSGWRAAVEAAERRGVAAPERPRVEARDPANPADIYRKWGWWSLNAGFTRSARFYGSKAVFAAPTRMASWKLFACSLRGH